MITNRNLKWSMHQHFSNMEELNKYILAKAIENNICEPWADKISSCGSIDEFLQMYVAGIDFCLSKNFPSNSDLQRLAGYYINQYGIYIDQQFKLSDRPILVALGSCTGEVLCHGYSVSQVYVKHDSRIALVTNDSAFVALDCLDNSTVDIVANGNSKVYVSLYSNAKITKSGSGTIKVVNKFKETY